MIGAMKKRMLIKALLVPTFLVLVATASANQKFGFKEICSTRDPWHPLPELLLQPVLLEPNFSVERVDLDNKTLIFERPNITVTFSGNSLSHDQVIAQINAHVPNAAFKWVVDEFYNEHNRGILKVALALKIGLHISASGTANNALGLSSSSDVIQRPVRPSEVHGYSVYLDSDGQNRGYRNSCVLVEVP